MKPLNQRYTADFFAEWGRHNRPYIESAAKIAGKIYELFKPGTMADLGCGCGVYGYQFQQLGAKVLALDGVVPPKEHAFPLDFILANLAEPLVNRPEKFDLAICFEVGEHIEPERSDVFLQNVTQFSDRVLLSCAPPNQGGHFHINEQPKRYWVKKMSERGFLYNRVLTGKLQEAFRVDPPAHLWMSSQISVYGKVGEFEVVEKNMPFRIRYENR